MVWSWSFSMEWGHSRIQGWMASNAVLFTNIKVYWVLKISAGNVKMFIFFRMKRFKPTLEFIRFWKSYFKMQNCQRKSVFDQWNGPVKDPVLNFEISFFEKYKLTNFVNSCWNFLTQLTLNNTKLGYTARIHFTTLHTGLDLKATYFSCKIYLYIFCN